MVDIEIKYFDKLPLCYQSVVTDLIAKLNSTEDVEVQKQYITEFHEKYTMIPELWKFYHRIEQNDKKQEKILESSLKHFWIFDLLPSKVNESFIPFTWNEIDGIENLIYPSFIATTAPIRNKVKILLKYLSFPHRYLNVIIKLYEEIAGSLSSDVKEMYLKNVEFYQQLKEHFFADDPMKFLDIVMKLENSESKYSNFEIFLGSRPYDKMIWEKYCQITQEKNTKERLLELYHRYQNLFFDDIEIKEKLLKVSELPESTSPLLSDVPSTTASDTMMKSNELKSIIENFTFKTAIFQRPFPFRKPLNNYLYDNLNGKALIKLQMSSKYFFQCFDQLVFQRLEITDERKNFYKNALNVRPKDRLFSKLQNISLTNSLFISSPKASKKIIPKIYKCDIKYLRIQFETLRLKDYEFFVQSGNIELLSLCDVIDESGDSVPLEVLLALTPKIFYVNLFMDHLTAQTFQNLLKLKFQSKILYFSMYDISQLIDVPSCILFFKENLGSNARINIEFNDDYPEDNYHTLYISLNAMADEWQPEDEKPQFDLFLSTIFM